MKIFSFFFYLKKVIFLKNKKNEIIVQKKKKGLATLSIMDDKKRVWDEAILYRLDSFIFFNSQTYLI